MANINIYPSTTTQTFTTSTQDILLQGVNSGLMIYNMDTGSTERLTISGSTGTIFSVSDSQTGLLWSVNDIAANPIAEIYSDAKINLADDVVISGIAGSGYCGIGLTNPTYKLHVYENASNYALKVENISGTGYGVYIKASTGTTGGNYFPLAVQDVEANNRFLVYGDGRLLAPYVYSVTVGATYRDLYIDNTGLIGYVSSTAKSKHNIVPIESIDWLYKLNPVNFVYNNDETKKIQSGLIAEEVLEVKPDFVSLNKEGEPETVLYSKLITPLLKAIQDLRQENILLKERITRLEELSK